MLGWQVRSESWPPSCRSHCDGENRQHAYHYEEEPQVIRQNKRPHPACRGVNDHDDRENQYPEHKRMNASQLLCCDHTGVKHNTDPKGETKNPQNADKAAYSWPIAHFEKFRNGAYAKSSQERNHEQTAEYEGHIAGPGHPDDGNSALVCCSTHTDQTEQTRAEFPSSG